MLKRKYCAIWRFCCDYKESDAVKSICEKEGGGKNISAQLVMQNYMLERLLERSRELHKFWRRYQREFEHDRDISLEAICETIQSIMKRLNKIENSEYMK